MITNGSVQAAETLYWFVAQALAKAGYVVLTSDPQGQGQSDEQGEAPDQNEGSPAQTDGRPFFDGTEDALNFFLSSASQARTSRCRAAGPARATRPSRTGASKAGLNAAFNPLWQLLDTSRLGLAGHSYGAAGVSYIAQWDPRVKAVVAWDNLGGVDPTSREQPCPANPAARRVVPIKKPGLGISADYFLPPQPNRSDPDPLAKSVSSHAYSKAGVDTGELIIRGGTHLDFDWIPNHGFPATLRGADEIDWYTTAWFDKYVKGDSSATAGCSPTAGTRTSTRPPWTRTTTATCGPSTTARGSTSTWPAGATSSARTCARPGVGAGLRAGPLRLRRAGHEPRPAALVRAVPRGAGRQRRALPAAAPSGQRPAHRAGQDRPQLLGVLPPLPRRAPRPRGHALLRPAAAASWSGRARARSTWWPAPRAGIARVASAPAGGCRARASAAPVAWPADC